MACWNTLPAELRLEIFRHAVPQGGFIVRRFRQNSWSYHPVTALVTVAREWQAFFEPYNFDKLALRQSDLPYFKTLYQNSRRQMLRWAWLRIELPLPKRNESSHNKNEAFTRVMKDFFDILRSWDDKRHDPDHGVPRDLTLLFSICPRSELAHEDVLKWDHEYHLNYDDPPSNLYSRAHVEPLTFTRSNQVHEEPLDVDFDDIDRPHDGGLFPKLNFVTGLWIPRKFCRAIPRIGLIIKSLPNLRVLRHEPWTHASPDMMLLQENYTLEMIKALPKSLTTLSIFQSSKAPEEWNYQWTLKAEAQELLRIASQALTKMDLSFIVTAEQFLRPFYPEFYNDDTTLSWGNLECLALTAESLNVEVPLQRITALLEAAAQAVLRMPKLHLLELWYGTESHARVFRYSVSVNRTLIIEWLDTGDPPVGLDKEVRKCWGKVADALVHGPLLVHMRQLSESDAGSYTRLLRCLRCFNRELPQLPTGLSRSMVVR
ncbi:hypothetical protein GGS26DRAFT_94284 [Hypomontagnella submonticulosa]|nr:hypothetical protein GGS26DRAFT_94284 [Hypomontagnella submonticulosa]